MRRYVVRLCVVTAGVLLGCGTGKTVESGSDAAEAKRGIRQDHRDSLLKDPSRTTLRRPAALSDVQMPLSRWASRCTTISRSASSCRPPLARRAGPGVAGPLTPGRLQMERCNGRATICSACGWRHVKIWPSTKTSSRGEGRNRSFFVPLAGRIVAPDPLRTADARRPS